MKRILTILFAVWCSAALAANNIWQPVGASTAGNTAANWSLAQVPTGTDVAYFEGDDGNEDNDCTFTAAISCLGMNVTSAYDGKVDMGDGNGAAPSHAFGSSGVIVAGSAGSEFDMGESTIGVTGGPWTVNAHAGTWTEDASTVTFDGTCTINSGNTNRFENMTVDSGTATVSTNITNVQGALIVNGILSVDTGKTLYSQGTVVIGDGGRLTGAGTGTINIYGPGTGKGVTSFHVNGTWDIPVTDIYQPGATAALASGNYQSGVRVYTATAAAATLTLSNGDYTFTSLELECTDGGGSITLDTTACVDDTITTGDLTLDDQAGEVAVTSTATAVDWTITGDVIPDGTGTITWTKGTGTITAQESPYLKNGGGFSFNGSSDEVDINAQVHDFGTDFTIAAWVRLPAVTSAGTRAIFTQGTNCRLLLTSAGKLEWWTDASGTTTAAAVVTANTWHYVMVTYDDTGTDVIKLYVDGAEVKTQDKTATNTAADSRIGSYLGSTNWFDGNIADVRVWDKALSTAERAELYNSGAGTTNTVADGNCVGWWLMDESAADKIAVDGGTGSNDGTSIRNTNVLRAPYNQAWDWSALTGEIEGVIVNKPFGTLTLTDDIDCTSWTQTDGTVDYATNNVTVTTTGNLTLSSGADGLAAGLPGCTLAVGGNFTATGTSAASKLDMTAASGWTLTVTGMPIAKWVDVSYSNASGGNTIRGTGCTNSGNNQKWRYSIIPIFQHYR